jgi:hypothetical protein
VVKNVESIGRRITVAVLGYLSHYQITFLNSGFMPSALGVGYRGFLLSEGDRVKPGLHGNWIHCSVISGLYVL